MFKLFLFAFFLAALGVIFELIGIRRRKLRAARLHAIKSDLDLVPAFNFMPLQNQTLEAFQYLGGARPRATAPQDVRRPAIGIQFNTTYPVNIVYQESRETDAPRELPVQLPSDELIKMDPKKFASA
jgi:hypothetical protein